MNGSLGGLRLLGIAGCVIATPAFAELPPVIDQIPPQTEVFAVVGNVSSFLTNVESFSKVMPNGDLVELEEGLTFLKGLDGVNMDGSAAFLVVGDAGGMAEDPPVMALIPVTNFEQMVTSAGAEAFDGLHAVVLDEETVFMRAAGNGYAAVSPFEDAVRGYEPSNGHSAAHASRLGKVGDTFMNTSDLVVVADMKNVGPKIKQGFDEGLSQAQMGMMMAGQAMPDTTQLEESIGQMLEDAQVGLVGFRAGELGVGIHIGANFAPGSETAQAFSGSGTQTDLFSRIPADPFLVAISVDMTTPFVGELMTLFRQMNGPDQPRNPLFEDSKGWAMLIGPSAGGMMGGGLLTGGTAFFAFDDPAAARESYSQSMLAANGTEGAGFTIQTEYDADATQIGGVSADSWKMRMKFDPTDPAAQQAQMANMMIFGPAGGPGGYVAPTADGLVFTYAKRDELLEKGIAAAAAGGDLADVQSVAAVSALLPQRPAMQLLLGVPEIANMVMPMARMMGAPVPDMDIPEEMPPIGFAASVGGGGLHLGLFVPTEVIEIGASFAEMDGGGGNGAGQPRF